MRSIAVALTLLSIGRVSSSVAQERPCRESTTPRKLPAADALLDSARAIAELSALPGPTNGLFSFIYNEEDSLPNARPLERDSVSHAAALVLTQSLRPQRPTGIWGVRVRVAGGAAPVLTVERAMYCPPIPATVQARPYQIVVEMRVGDRQRPAGTTVRVIAEAEISEYGDVGEIMMLRPSGIQEIDDEILHDLKVRHFLPALLDGFPVPSVLRADGRTKKLWERPLLSGVGTEAAFSLTVVP